jgi:hypothetical protein
MQNNPLLMNLNYLLSLTDGKMSHTKKNIRSCGEDNLGRQIWMMPDCNPRLWCKLDLCSSELL